MHKGFYTLKWEGDSVSFIDQRKLPVEEIYVSCRTYKEVAEAIETMVVRGAPAIGVSAAYGIALGLIKSTDTEIYKYEAGFKEICDIIGATRPTAVNLFWAIERMKKAFAEIRGRTSSVSEISAHMLSEAHSIYDEDINVNKAIGRAGSSLVKSGMNILTHCNAGALCAAGYGTALGVVRAAFEQGKKIHVFADETRPFLQGARLTMWELMKDGIDCTLLSDNMSGYMMSKGKIDVIVVGADRIAANGDAANKIGTYSVAVLAKHHNIPMYFAAPLSTVDINCPSGGHIPIEERNLDEVRVINGKSICPPDAKAVNPSFDVTPNSLISGIITEKGIIYPPFESGIKSLFSGGDL
ncbi:MAG: S-methyl-5-thioribose-1-phosphate isomerase [Oligoflexia bacterium]|nr:S-methyl-5-thioribose-1-phosphate isomerase [Oligoflexia bacterium]